jgi:transcriptional regulator with XRE-family HTH domain
LDVTTKQVSVWENSSSVGWRTLERIAQALGTSVEHIVNVGQEGSNRTGQELRKEFEKRLEHSQPETGIDLEPLTQLKTPKGQKSGLLRNLDLDIRIWPSYFKGSHEDFIVAVTDVYCRFVKEKLSWPDDLKSETTQTIRRSGSDQYVVISIYGTPRETILLHSGRSPDEEAIPKTGEEADSFRDIVSRLSENKELRDSVGWLLSDERYDGLWKAFGSMPRDLNDTDLGAIARALQSTLRMIKQLKLPG